MAQRKARSKRKRTSAQQAAPRRRRRRAAGSGVLVAVRAARRSAAKALGALREEIAETCARLEKLLAEQRDFVAEIGGRGAPGRPAQRGAARPVRVRRPRRKGPPKADAFFAKLPERFTIEDVRKVAGRLSGVSLAQWSRAKKVRKRRKGYEKIAKTA